MSGIKKELIFIRYADNSPWGEIDSYEELYPGIYLVGTPSHGGIQVEREGAILLSPAARKCGFWEGGSLWFEEDCCEPVVLRELLDKGLWQIPERIKDSAAFERSLDSTIKEYHPEYWAFRQKQLNQATKPRQKNYEDISR